ncbi:hypothetical protein GCM10009691_20740 [Brevibacterium picturae]|uniref:ArsR family transcriptional regulator n=1 Tax=Brevibacterium picturae TaxID=260553 RepID=A0ABP4MQ09_9MICO
MDVDKQMCGLDPEGRYVELAVEMFGLLSDATRVRIILGLRRDDELSVNRIAEVVRKSSAAVAAPGEAADGSDRVDPAGGRPSSSTWRHSRQLYRTCVRVCGSG